MGTLVKVSAKSENAQNLLMQSPNNSGIWGDVTFYINDDTCQKCDYWIIYNDLDKTEQCIVDPRNIWLIDVPPYVGKIINQYFLNQFAHIITPAELTNLKGKIHNVFVPEIWNCGKDYTTLLNEPFPNKKTPLSVISYNLYENTLDFLIALRNQIDITVYGATPLVNYENDYDIMNVSKYHIVLENEIIDNNWSAALSRCYLNWTYPIYYGGDISNFFDSTMYFSIDINDVTNSINNIETFIRTNNYVQSVQYIMKARHSILNEYNFYPYMLNICQENKHNGFKELTTLRPRSTYTQFETAIILQDELTNAQDEQDEDI